MSGPEIEAVDAEEAMVRRVRAAPRAARVLAIALPVLIVLGEVTLIETLRFRAVVLGLGLALAFLTLRARDRYRDALVHGLALLTLALCMGIAASGRGFLSRAADPATLDVAAGLLLLVLVIAGAWVSTGAALPVMAGLTIAYVLFGSALDRVGLSAIAHRGYDLQRLVGSMVMGFEGVFGVPLDVAATTIGLFAIYGAVLEASGAATFFLDLAFSVFSRGEPARNAGRAVTFAGFLLGSVSGSGVATTLTLGGASAPLLLRAGFTRENAGALLAASGIGAILSPPTLGAAAFLIAEFLKIPYGQVLVMAVIPTLLYYFGILRMIDADAGSYPAASSEAGEPRPGNIRAILAAGFHHLLSPFLIVALLCLGYSATRAALAATGAALFLTFVRPRHREEGTRRNIKADLMSTAISAGGSLVPVIATTACAGILVSGLTLTGLGLKAAGLVVHLAGQSAVGVILLSALAVSVLGLSVPVTASYILSAVTIAPALIQVGVNELAAHMFIFYYAVLSEVSPPTALAPMAAATILRGDPYRTVVATLRYTLPAFLVPLAFTLRADGAGILLRGDASGIATSAFAATCIVVAASAAASGRISRRALTPGARLSFAASALLLLMPSAVATLFGVGLLGVTGLWIAVRRDSGGA